MFDEAYKPKAVCVLILLRIHHVVKKPSNRWWECMQCGCPVAYIHYTCTSKKNTEARYRCRVLTWSSATPTAKPTFVWHDMYWDRCGYTGFFVSIPACHLHMFHTNWWELSPQVCRSCLYTIKKQPVPCTSNLWSFFFPEYMPVESRFANTMLFPKV